VRTPNSVGARRQLTPQFYTTGRGCRLMVYFCIIVPDSGPESGYATPSLFVGESVYPTTESPISFEAATGGNSVASVPSRGRLASFSAHQFERQAKTAD
jgi:hypothetical protein